MLKELSCRCGLSKKRFKHDIGPFFINDCCEAKGYDVHGKMKGTPPENPSPSPTIEVVADPTMKADEAKLVSADQTVTIQNIAPPKAPQKPGKNRLLDMRLPDLKAMAESRGVVVTPEATKKQLVEAILGTYA